MSAPVDDAPEAPAPRRRRRWPWIVALLALPLLLTVALLALLSTNAGLELIRGLAEGAANDALSGRVKIGRLEGSALSTLRLSDLEIDDPEGRPAVRLESLELTWRPAALLGGEVHVETLSLRHPRILAVTSSAGLNLARLVPPSETPPEPSDAPPLPLDLPALRVDAARIEGGAFGLEGPSGPVLRIDGLELDVGARAEGPDVQVDLRELSARLLERYDVRLAAQAQLRGEQVEVGGLELEAAGARLSAPKLAATLPPGRVDGSVALVLPSGLAARLGGPDALRAGLELEVDVAREAAAPRWSTRATGRLANAPLTLSATVTEDLSEVALALALRGLDPRAVHAEAPQGDLSVRLDATANAASLPKLEAEADLRIEGRITPPGLASVQVAPIDMQSSLRGGHADAKITGRVGGAALDIDAAVAGVFGQPHIERARARVDVPDLGAVVGARAAGRLTITATASGPLDALRAEGQVAAAGLRWGKLARAHHIDGVWALAGLPARPTGRVDFEAAGLVADGRPVRRVAVRAEARQREGATEVDVQTLELATGPLVWRGGGAQVRFHPSEGLEIRDLGLRSRAGELSLDAQASSTGAPAAQVDLRLDRIDLSKLPRGLAPELGELAGNVNLALTARRAGPRVHADVQLRGEGLRALDAHPSVDVKADVSLTPERLVGTATVGLEGGALTLRARARPPKRMDDGGAWARALSGRPVEHADLRFEGLALTTLERFAGRRLFDRGRLDGEVRIAGPAPSAQLWIDVQGAKSADMDLEGALALRAGYDPGEVWARAKMGGGPFGSGTVSATASAPRALFAVDEWARLGPTSLRGAEVDVVGTRLEVLDALGIVPGLKGRLEARIEASRGLTAVRARVKGEQVRLPGLAARLDAESVSRLDHRLESRLSVDLDGRPAVRGLAEVGLSLPALLAGAPIDAPKLPVRAEIEIDALPLKPFAGLARLDPKSVQGTLTASVGVRGRVGRPRGRAAVRFSGLRLAKTPFRLVRADATWQSVGLRASTEIVDDAGGRLSLEARANEDLEDLQARLRAEGLDLSFASKLGLLPIGLEARLFADVTVTGPIERPAPRGWLEARGLRVVFAQAALQPLYGGKARVELFPERAKLSVRADAAGGKIAIDGAARFPAGGRPDFEATTTLETFPVAAGTLVRVDLVADAKGRVDEDATRVQVELRDGFVQVPDEETDDLHPIAELDDVVYVDRLPGGTGGLRTKTSTRAAGPPTLIELRTRAPVDVRGGPVDAAFVTEIDATSDARGVHMTGKAYASEGALTLFRRRYVIERAELAFEGNVPPNPRVNVRLRHEFGDLTFFVLVRGPADSPEVEFAASPARYSQAELLTIFLGTDPSELGQKDDRSVEQQALGAVTGLFVGWAQDQLGKSLPIDTLDVEVGDTSRGGAGTRVTLGKWITRRLFLAYRYRFEANTELENDNEALVQYRFLPGWMLEVVLGLTRNDADIIWTKRF